ncbi:MULTISPECIES: hypothetical protein [unclassified Bradyrhizobium]|uniref:hypothetical protein n=1 Tax=unclassified Bradyrhizobium TaxID=2631580 RepID=UPI001FFAFF2F|nr:MULTISPECIES: hypothetical protein [unclassified Bradyrhizobium]MCK1536826.1 hypothetical protein [Bradyrhizobium sp. 176]MCK1560129.1 hypothetical protein [Bradyrhizobium sp. 171]
MIDIASLDTARDSQTHALCQDCLRLLAWGDLVLCENDPPGLCPICNGQTCHCAGCMQTVRFLSIGDFTNPDAGLLRPELIVSWSAAEGAVRRTETQQLIVSYADNQLIEFRDQQLAAIVQAFGGERRTELPESEDDR